MASPMTGILPLKGLSLDRTGMCKTNKSIQDMQEYL